MYQKAKNHLAPSTVHLASEQYVPYIGMRSVLRAVCKSDLFISPAKLA